MPVVENLQARGSKRSAMRFHAIIHDEPLTHVPASKVEKGKILQKGYLYFWFQSPVRRGSRKWEASQTLIHYL